MTRMTMLNRRQMLAAGVSLAVATGLPWRTAAQTVRRIGEKQVRSIGDGYLTLPVSFLFPDVPEAELTRLLAENGLDTETLTPPCNLTLVETGDRRVLFDAGAGPNFMPTAGELLERLEVAGHDPADITDVVFTHGHPDHLWGILDDFDEITFPEARLFFPQPEWDFWRADGAIEKMDEGRQAFAVGAKNRLEAIEERVELFEDGAELAPGIEAVATHGHTPGHMSFAIHAEAGSADAGLMVIGDALTNHFISFERPKWPSGSDQEPERAIETRLRLLDRLASEKMPIIGYHLPEGGEGRVERHGDAYRFIAA